MRLAKRRSVRRLSSRGSNFQRGQRPVTLTEGVVQPFKSRRDGTFYIVGIRLAGREPLFSGSRHGLWWLATICLAALTLLVVLLKPNSK
jgi:hypothetical protein